MAVVDRVVHQYPAILMPLFKAAPAVLVIALYVKGARELPQLEREFLRSNLLDGPLQR